MHSYITDSTERRHVPLASAVLAVLLSWALNAVLTALHVSIPWWIDAPSVAGFYGILYKAFDTHCWRWSVWHITGVVKVPVLGGEWTGYVLSSHDDFAAQHPVQVEIRQDWTRMRVTLQGRFSHSHSIVAAILTEAPDGIVLDYEYQNEPVANAVETMQIHHGTARLTLSGTSVLQGYYYTGRGRGNHGHVHLSRVLNSHIAQPNGAP